MRVFILATILLASSSLSPSFAQQDENAPVAAPQAGAPAQPDQNLPRDQRTDRNQPKADDHAMGRGGMMHRGESDRMGCDCREMGSDHRMLREREMGRGRDMDRGRYGEREDRDGDHADRDRDNSGYFDEDRPRRRVKICIEYENGDEYCHYRR